MQTSNTIKNVSNTLSPARMTLVFLVLALAHFFSTLIRAITATLAPTLTSQLQLQAADLGLLASGYFLGFALMQIPLGRWLDRHGPRPVLLVLLALAAVGCVGFSMANSFAGLLLARVLCGAGVSACLMGALTGYRRWFSTGGQLRANAWMLMVGSLGMLFATLPVQGLVTWLGWRQLFVVLAIGLLLTLVLIYALLPAWAPPATMDASRSADTGYRQVWSSPQFWRLVPLGFFGFGGLVSIQTLWASPWMVQIGGWTPTASATGLFGINLAMMLSFWLWGWITPALHRGGITIARLIAWGTPASHCALAWLVIQGPSEPAWIPFMLTLFCIGSTFVSLSQSLIGLSFPPHLAGRALSSYNLVIFSGVFVIQWAIGYGIDTFQDVGYSRVAAFQITFALLGCGSFAGWLFFVSSGLRQGAGAARLATT